MLVNSGVLLVKLYFSVSREEQQRRFGERRTNPLKRWKLSPTDLAAEQKWDDYTTLIKSDDKMRARINAMRYVLHRWDYRGKDAAAIGEPDQWLMTQASEIYPAVP